MAVIKVACPQCGQKVSGDETFHGRSVDCPICSAKIHFPANPDLPSDPSSLLENEVAPTTQSRASSSVSSSLNQPSPLIESDPELPPPPQFESETIESNSATKTVAAPNPISMSSDADETGTDSSKDAPSPLIGILSLVVGSLNTLTVCIGGLILAPVAVILGHIALNKAKASPVQPAPGKKMGLIGLILGYLGLPGTLIMLIAVMLGLKNASAVKEDFEEAREATKTTVEEPLEPTGETNFFEP